MQELARLRPSISEPKHKAEPQSHCFHSSGATVAVAAGGCCTDWHPDKVFKAPAFETGLWSTGCLPARKGKGLKKDQGHHFSACLFDSSQKHSLTGGGVRTVPLKSTHCCSQHKSRTFCVTPLATKSACSKPFFQEAAALLNLQQSQEKGCSHLSTTAANVTENGACVPNAQPVLNKTERNKLS